MPNVSELKMPEGYDVALWHYVVLPAGTPPQVVERLNASIKKVLADESARGEFAKFGAEPKSSTPAELAACISGELVRWRKIANEAGIEPTDWC